MRYAHWTDAEVATLRSLFPDHTAREIADALGRGVRQIHHKAHKLGLRKSPEWIAEHARAAMADPDHPARRTQWTAGHVPYNKGKPHPTRGRSAETQFRPGNRRPPSPQPKPRAPSRPRWKRPRSSAGPMDR